MGTGATAGSLSSGFDSERIWIKRAADGGEKPRSAALHLETRKLGEDNKLSKGRPVDGPRDPKTGEFLEGRIETEGIQGGQIHRGPEWRRRFKRARTDSHGKRSDS